MRILSGPTDCPRSASVLCGIGLVAVLLLVMCSIAARAETVRPKYGTPYFGPDYNYPWTPRAIGQSLGAVAQISWQGFVAYYGANTGCSYSYAKISNPYSLVVGRIYYHGVCEGAYDDVFGFPYCPSGYKLDPTAPPGSLYSTYWWYRMESPWLKCALVNKPKYELSITAQKPIIPYGSGVSDNERVLTRSWLQLLLTKNNQPVSGQSPPIQSSRGENDTIDELDVTNSQGIATGYVDTRDQPGTSALTSASSKIATAKEGDTTWLPALYQGTFEITCYAVAQESLDTSGPLVWMSGLPGLSPFHHESFVTDTNMQGTGYTLDHFYIKKWDGLWHKVKCPRTAVWHCAEKGKTVAVDLHVVPLSSVHHIYSQLNISGDLGNRSLGDRVAEDDGTAIIGNHIDIFYGRTVADYQACIQAGKSYGHQVTFESY